MVMIPISRHWRMIFATVWLKTFLSLPQTNMCRVQAGLTKLDTYRGGFPRYYTDIYLGAYSHMETVMSRAIDRGNMLRHAEVIDATALDSVGDLMNLVIN